MFLMSRSVPTPMFPRDTLYLLKTFSLLHRPVDYEFVSGHGPFKWHLTIPGAFASALTGKFSRPLGIFVQVIFVDPQADQRDGQKELNEKLHLHFIIMLKLCSRLKPHKQSVTLNIVFQYTNESSS